MSETRRMLAERMVHHALDIAAYILEQRHRGKPVYVDWIDHPELKELVTKLVMLPDHLATKQLDAALHRERPRR
jgi:hypothetical protein